MSGSRFLGAPIERRSRRGGAALGPAGAAGALLVTAGLLAGCTSPRDVLGSAASPCYRAVAVARIALHGEGRFSGVRPLRGTGLSPALAGFRAPSSGLAYGPATPLCLVAYRGHFEASRLASALRPAPATDRLAVVIVRQRDVRVVATLLFDGAPPRALARLLPAR